MRLDRFTTQLFCQLVLYSFSLSGNAAPLTPAEQRAGKVIFKALQMRQTQRRQQTADRPLLENHKAALRGGSQMLESNIKPTLPEELPLDQIEKKLLGKMFFVQTLPSLSADGRLIATFNYEGVHVGFSSGQWVVDCFPKGQRKTVHSDWLSTLHFTINHLVPSDHYAGARGGGTDRPFVVIVPVNTHSRGNAKSQDSDLLDKTVSASFPEVVVLGDHVLPKDSLILVRSDKRHEVPPYYLENGFKIIEYEGILVDGLEPKPILVGNLHESEKWDGTDLLRESDGRFDVTPAGDLLIRTAIPSKKITEKYARQTVDFQLVVDQNERELTGQPIVNADEKNHYKLVVNEDGTNSNFSDSSTNKKLYQLSNKKLRVFTQGNFYKYVREKIIADDYTKKRDAVNKTIKENGGFLVDMSDAFDGRPWAYKKVTDSKGNNLNTIEFFKKLFPNKPVAFGEDDTTHWDSEGEQWRMQRIRQKNRALQFYGEIGFSIEEYHSKKLNKWLDQLHLAPQALAQHRKIEKNSLIAYRAMDYIFDHFKSKEAAFGYIETHLMELENKGTLAAVRNDPDFEKKSVDELAKKFCDFDFLILQRPSAQNDLTDSKNLLESLMYVTNGMKPDEAKGVLKTFFSKSSIIRALSEQEAEELKARAILIYFSNFKKYFYNQGGGPFHPLARNDYKDYKAVIESLVQEVDRVGLKDPSEAAQLEEVKEMLAKVLQ